MYSYAVFMSKSYTKKYKNTLQNHYNVNCTQILNTPSKTAITALYRLQLLNMN